MDSKQQIVNQFNSLRSEQRQLAIKVSELESDVTEHKLVMEALQEVDPKRKCFRMIGGVLVERSVEQVLPSLQTNHNMIQQLVSALKSQIVTKGQEIQEFMQKHEIEVRVGDRPPPKSGQSADSNSVLVEN